MNSRILLYTALVANILALQLNAREMQKPTAMIGQQPDKEEDDIRKIKIQMRQGQQKPAEPQTVTRRRGGRKITMAVNPAKKNLQFNDL